MDRLNNVLGAAVLGVVLADSVHAVWTGVVPSYQLGTSWGLLLGAASVALAIWAHTPAERFAWLFGLLFVLVSATLPWSRPDRAQSTVLTLLFTMAVSLLASTRTSRASVATVVVAAIAAAVVRWVTLG